MNRKPFIEHLFVTVLVTNRAARENNNKSSGRQKSVSIPFRLYNLYESVDQPVDFNVPSTAYLRLNHTFKNIFHQFRTRHYNVKKPTICIPINAL